MRDDKRKSRKAAIEAEAYALFAQLGFEGTSMLAVAKRAKASNETLYRWYDDKNGLFESMVSANAEVVLAALHAADEGESAPLERLGRVAPVLLDMLLSDRAIMLNRAAASDPTGALGALLAKAGRADVLPLIAGVLQDAVAAGDLCEGEGRDGKGLAALFVKLLVGDQQIRRVIGTLPAPSPQQVTQQAQEALAQFVTLCAP